MADSDPSARQGRTVPSRRRKRKPMKYYKSVESLAQEADDRVSEVAFLSQQVRHFLKKKSNFTQPECVYSQGSVLFIDISGFTKLGKKLKENHEMSVATEKLAEVIMAALKVLTAICLTCRGDVAKFAGDALLCVWKSENKEEALFQAKRAGILMLQKIKQFNKHLDLHGGISYGTLIDFHLVKKHRKSQRALRWHLLSGSASSCAGDLLEKAPKGVILVENEKDLDSLTIKTPVSLEFSERTTSSFSNLPPIRTLSQSLSRDLVTSYIPELVLNKIRGGDAIGGEIVSNVSVMFVAFDSLLLTKEEMMAKVAPSKIKRLNASFVKLMKLMKNSGGEIRDLLFDDKGCIFIGVFGAHLMTEDSERKAVIAAQRLSAAFKNTRIGVSSGACYAGLCGTLSRNDFVVMGHEVNQAARFCGQAKNGTILVSKGIKEKLSAYFKFDFHEFEKKNEKFECYYLKEERLLSEFESDTSICIGRTEERTKILKHLKKASSEPIILKGDKGIGKSTLLYSLKNDLEDNYDIIYVSGAETEIHSFLFLYTQILLALLGLKELTFHKVRAKTQILNIKLNKKVMKLLNVQGKKSKRISSNNSIVNSMPPLRVIPKSKMSTKNPKAKLGRRLNRTNTEASKNNSSMTFSIKNSSLHSLASQGAEAEYLPEKDIIELCKFLRELIKASLAKSEKARLLLILDDLHYCDDNSISVIMHLIRSHVALKVSFICSYRSFNSLSYIIKNRIDDLEERLLCLKHLQITLDPLKGSEIKALAVYHLELIFDLPPSKKERDVCVELVLVLNKQTKGLPNFVEVLLKYYFENQMLAFDRAQGLFHFEKGMYEKAIENMPKGIVEIAGFHLNSLDGIQKRILKLAACIGMKFSRAKLWKILTKDGVSYSYEDYQLVLKTLIQRNFLHFQKTKRFSVIRRPDMKQSKLSSNEQHEFYEFAWSVYQEAVLNLIPTARQVEIKEFLADLDSLNSASDARSTNRSAGPLRLFSKRKKY